MSVEEVPTPHRALPLPRRAVLKRALAGVAGLAVAPVLAACGQTSNALPQPSKAAVTLVWSTWGDNTNPMVQASAQGADAFKKLHPNITVQPEPQLKGWADKILTQMVAGSGAPDLIGGCCFTLPSWAAKGLLVKLDPYIARDLSKQLRDDFDPLQYGAFSRPGIGQYALPMYMGTIGLFYNKDRFQAAGVSFPTDSWDWNSWAEAMAKLTNVAKQQWGGILLYENWQIWLNQNGGHEVDPSNDLRCVLDSTESIGAGQWLHDQMFKTNVAIQPGQIPKGVSWYQGLVNGRFATAYFGSFQLRQGGKAGATDAPLLPFTTTPTPRSSSSTTIRPARCSMAPSTTPCRATRLMSQPLSKPPLRRSTRSSSSSVRAERPAARNRWLRCAVARTPADRRIVQAPPTRPGTEGIGRTTRPSWASSPERDHVVTDVDVAIVGAGHNGLVAAAYLARAGLAVHLFERRPFAGGASITEELWPGFHFSTCAHMIHGLHPKLIRDLRLRERGLRVLPRAGDLLMWPDGTYSGPATLDSPRNRDFGGRLTAAERVGLRRYQEFRWALERLFAPYRLQPPPSLAAVRARVAGTPEAAVLERALTARLSEIQQELLPSERLRERVAAEKASVERDPLALSWAYSSIDAPEEETGEWPPHGYVAGGMGTVARLLAEAAEEAGATIHVDQAVEQLMVEDGRVIGLQLADGTEVRSRVVVSNLDPKRTFLKLLAPEHLAAGFRDRVAGLMTAVSCYKFLAAISELPRWAAWDGDPDRPSHGAVGLHRSRAEVTAMWEDLEACRPPRAPVISFSVPSAVDPSLAPPGYHTASAWIFSAPAKLREGSWDDVREQAAERLIDQITAYAPNFRRSILHYKLRTPLDLERDNGLTDGCIWHVQHGGEQLLWNRPLPELANYRSPLPGLYLCGAGQHPCGEVTGVPGHNAAHEVLRDW